MKLNSKDNTSQNVKIYGVEIQTNEVQSIVTFDSNSKLYKILKLNAEAEGMYIKDYINTLILAVISGPGKQTINLSQFLDSKTR